MKDIETIKKDIEDKIYYMLEEQAESITKDITSITSTALAKKIIEEVFDSEYLETKLNEIKEEAVRGFVRAFKEYESKYEIMSSIDDDWVEQYIKQLKKKGKG